jgi:hypothetical protein
MAAQLFQMAQAKGVTLNDDDMMDDDDDDDDSIDNNDMVSSSLDEAVDNDDDDDDEDDVEPNIPQGAINAFLRYDTGNVGDKLAGKVDLTDDQLYSEDKERVLDTAGGFVDMIRGPSEDDDDDDDDGDEDDDNPTVVNKIMVMPPLPFAKRLLMQRYHTHVVTNRMVPSLKPWVMWDSLL